MSNTGSRKSAEGNRKSKEGNRKSKEANQVTFINSTYQRDVRFVPNRLHSNQILTQNMAHLLTKDCISHCIAARKHAKGCALLRTNETNFGFVFYECAV